MSVADVIHDLTEDSGALFETEQSEVVDSILKSPKVFFLDTCFVTKSFFFDEKDIFEAFIRLAEGDGAVFVVTELVLYELKDSASNTLQKKNREFFEHMKEQGFRLLLLKEETVCENIKQYMNYSAKEWNEKFAGLIHDNAAVLGIVSKTRNDSRMPYFGFSELGYKIPADKDFIKIIIKYYKSLKTARDSLAEELVAISLFFILKLPCVGQRENYIFCTHDFSAIVRINKAIQTSYPSRAACFKTIHLFGFFQYMVSEGILTSAEHAADIMEKVMGNSVDLIVKENAPFSYVESRVDVKHAVEMVFDKKDMVLVGRQNV